MEADMAQHEPSLVIDRGEYRDKVYACWLGKNIGGTLGAPWGRAHSVFPPAALTIATMPALAARRWSLNGATGLPNPKKAPRDSPPRLPQQPPKTALAKSRLLRA